MKPSDTAEQHEAPDTSRHPGLGGRRSAGDLAGLQAAGAHVEARAGAVDRRADPLDVGVEAALGDLLRPRPVVAEARLLGADVADGSHGSTPGVEGGTGPLEAGNRERISDAAARARISGRRAPLACHPGGPGRDSEATTTDHDTEADHGS